MKNYYPNTYCNLACVNIVLINKDHGNCECDADEFQ